jgi:branched-chain amino acid transport system ATP-binding protein
MTVVPPTAVQAPGLDIRRLCVARGGSSIVRDVTLCAPPGAITVLLGANGAGKTTLLEAISGIIPATSGDIRLDGVALGGLARRARARRGLAHVEQGRTTFATLTVEENLRAASGDAEALAEGFALFPELEPRRRTLAGLLSGGEQQMLVLARALATRPRLLLIDELSLGLAPAVVARLMPVLGELAARGVGVLVVEQYAGLILRAGDHAYVMARGAIVYDGDCAPLLETTDILRGAYLAAGGGGEAA